MKSNFRMALWAVVKLGLIASVIFAERRLLAEDVSRVDVRWNGEWRSSAEINTAEISSLYAPSRQGSRNLFENREIPEKLKISSCGAWNSLTASERKNYPADKFTQIDINSIRDVCWLVQKISMAQTPRISIGLMDQFAQIDLFPAGFAYNGFLGETEYVRNAKLLAPSNSSFFISLPEHFKADLPAIRKIIWRNPPASLSEVSSIIFEPTISFIQPSISLERGENGVISGNFLRTIFSVSVIATDFDEDKDGIEDWGAIVEMAETNAFWRACFPAIISRIKSGNGGVSGPFFIKETLPSRRCG